MVRIHIQNLSFSYPGANSPALSDVNLSIAPGEYVLLCGKSGSGKTTLLRHLKTVLAPHGLRSGSVKLDGVPLEQVSQGSQAARIGFVMQNPDDQIVTDKVWHELAFGLENLGCDQKTMRLRVAEMASFFGIQDWFHREVSELSGGQKQLLNLASIMAMQPEVLILDEPTAGLDPVGRAEILGNIENYRKAKNATIMMVSHSMEDVARMTDRLLVLYGSHLVMDAPPAEVFAHAQELVDMGLNIPQVTQIFLCLKELGLPVENVYTREQAVSLLRRMKEERSHA